MWSFMIVHRWPLSLLGFMVLLGQPFRPPEQPAFTLEIPELQVTVEGDSSSSLTRTNFNSFRIVIHGSQISYGSIRSKINTESAGIIMTTRAVGDTVVCSFDLGQHSGFRFVPGRNSVEIEASDSRHRVLYASFLLDAGVPSTSVRNSPTHAVPQDMHGVEKYAVVIGVSHYKDSSIQQLHFADRDAQAIREFLLSPEGGRFKPDKIAYLVNEEATLKNIRTALYTFLTAARQQDLVLIYFAGHGQPDPHDPRNLYLLPYDTETYNMGGTAFPMWEVQDVFSRVIKAQRIVTFTDACHSRGISGESAEGPSQGRGTAGWRRDAQAGPGNNLFNQYLARYAGDNQRAVLTASDISEYSMEGASWGGGHGVFTHFLLEGLRGKADRNADGTVTAGELFDYVQERVVSATGKLQNPTALPGLARDLPLSGRAVRASLN
jgi:uncharacterized caspase-like protein